MSRVNPRSLDSKDRSYYLDLLWSSIADLSSREEAKNFFKDLLSETEAIMLARRIVIAKLLLEGKGYDLIMEDLKTSPTTIAQVDKWLTSGFGGYEKALNKLKKKSLRTSSKETNITELNSFEGLKKKYPLHFALFNLFDEKK